MASFGSYGDVYPYIGLARALRERGHHPVLAMPGLYRDLVTQEQIEFWPVRPDLRPEDRALAGRIMEPSRGTEVLFNELLIPSLAAAHADLLEASADADLLVTHPASLAGPIVAGERGLRWISTVLAPMSFFSAADPVVPPAAPWVHAITSRSVLLASVVNRAAERLTRKWAEPVQRFRESRGLPRGLNPILAGQHSPHAVLALFSRVLAEPQPDWPDHVTVTGPILYNGADAAAMPRAVADFLASGDPPIVFTLGTSAVWAPGSFFELSARAVHRLGRRAILLSGKDAGNQPTFDTPGVIAVEFARHADLFPHAAAIVHQGGAGTLHQALRSGRPMLVVPHAHDQPDNAHRLTRLGVARTLYPSQYGVERVARELGALIDGPSYGARAQAIRSVVAAEDGEGRACEVIESMLQGP
jgi:rhamnosyltransferase subunit B